MYRFFYESKAIFYGKPLAITAIFDINFLLSLAMICFLITLQNTFNNI